MPLYLKDAKLLVDVDSSKLATSEDCCCGCECCAATPGTHTFRVVGVEESATCTALDPSDNCTALNRDYVWLTGGTCETLESGACQIHQTQNLAFQVCGWTTLWAEMTITWDELIGQWSVEFVIYGRDALNNEYLVLQASKLLTGQTSPGSCEASRDLDAAVSFCAYNVDTFNVVYQPSA